MYDIIHVKKILKTVIYIMAVGDGDEGQIEGFKRQREKVGVALGRRSPLVAVQKQ
jgi:hypothetical protein